MEFEKNKRAYARCKEIFESQGLTFPINELLTRVFGNYVVDFYILDDMLERLFPGYDSLYQTYKGKPTTVYEMIQMLKHGDVVTMHILNLLPQPNFHEFSDN